MNAFATDDEMMQTALGFDRPFTLSDITVHPRDGKNAHALLRRLVAKGELQVANPHVDGRARYLVQYVWTDDGGALGEIAMNKWKVAHDLLRTYYQLLHGQSPKRVLTTAWARYDEARRAAEEAS